MIRTRPLLLALAIQLAPATGALAVIEFIQGESLPVPPRPNFVAMGDFNEDGFDDVVVSSIASDQVSVLFTGPDGSFTDTTTLLPPDFRRPRDVAVGDFGCSSPSDPACVENAAGKFVDGNLDIVMGDRGAQSVFIFFGDGRGRFSSPSDVPIGGRAQRLAVADFEQDGDTDIAVTDITGNRTLVLVNNGNSFPQFNVIELPSGDETIAPDDVVAADFNRDGRPDILVLNTGSTRVKDVTLYLFDRTIRDIPVFQRFGNFLVGRNPSDLIIADFDQDGFADDAAMLNRPQRDDVTQVEFLFSRLRDCNVEGRNCTFVAFDPQPPLVLRCPSGNLICRGRAMRAGDFDNDDIVDLAVALSEREGDIHDLAILGGRGNGAYVEDVFFFLDVPGEAMTLGFFDLGPFLDIALAKVRNVRVDLFLNVSGRLPGERCEEDEDCRSGVCVGGVCCGRDLGDCCEEDTDCESGFCVDGVCCNERCPDGICDVPGTEGICLLPTPTPTITRISMPRPPGAPCAEDADCEPGLFCVDGVCCFDPFCPTGQFCVGIGDGFPGFEGLCIPGTRPPTRIPTLTPTGRPPTIVVSRGGGCSTGGGEPPSTGSGVALALLLPTVLWLRRRWQLQRAAQAMQPAPSAEETLR
jgi:hypothetical protein